jgi:hypothetical protein
MFRRKNQRESPSFDPYHPTELSAETPKINHVETIAALGFVAGSAIYIASSLVQVDPEGVRLKHDSVIVQTVGEAMSLLGKPDSKYLRNDLEEIDHFLDTELARSKGSLPMHVLTDPFPCDPEAQYC